MSSISKNDLLLAKEKIRDHVIRTPILTSDSINKIAGCELFFKCENFQKIGAFKIRGAMNAALSLSAEERKDGLLCHSSGNHAQAISMAAKLLNIPSYIVMPETAPKIKIKGVYELGGKIYFCKPTLEARESMTKELQRETGAKFIPPFNDETIICGQSTCAMELFEELNELDVLLCPVGGGGLLAGSSLARNFFSPSCQVIAGEPEGADDAYRSLKEGKLVPLTESNTIADGLITSLGSITYPIIRDNVSSILLANDDEIKKAMQLIWERLKIVIEPSSAVPLAALLRNKESYIGKKVGLILTGGNVDLDSFFESI